MQGAHKIVVKVSLSLSARMFDDLHALVELLSVSKVLSTLLIFSRTITV